MNQYDLLALLSICLIIAIDSLIFWPTIRKSYNAPLTEPLIPYFLSGQRSTFMLMAIPDPTWKNLIYPLFLIAADWGFFVYIIIRRSQLSLPLTGIRQRL